MKELLTNFATKVDTVGTDKNLTGNIINIINGVIVTLGLVCVIVVVVGGINYMTSSGDPGKVKKAKDTILYAIIGLIVCVLAFAIVNFVIANLNNSQAGTYTDQASCVDAGWTWQGGKCIAK